MFSKNLHTLDVKQCEYIEEAASLRADKTKK